MVNNRNIQFDVKKRIAFLALILVIVAVTLFFTAAPVMADAPVSETITLLSGGTTLTAGYTYDNPYYDIETFVSSPATETAGYTTFNPSADPLNPVSYSGSWSAAQVVTDTASPWVSIGGGSWVSTTSLNSGVENPAESDTWRLFQATFNVADAGAVMATGIQIAADNAYEFYFNGVLIDSTVNWIPSATVYGVSPGPGGTMIPFEYVAAHSLTLQSGVNTMMFVVRNWDNSGMANPSGLIYKVTLQYAIMEQQLDPSVYSFGSWTPAIPVTVPASTWVQTTGGAPWVSTTADYSGTDDDYPGDAWRLFKDEFTIPDGATIDSATIQISGDNAFELYLNGVLIETTDSWSPPATVYGDSPEPGGTMIPFEQVATYTLSPQAGLNTLMFVVRNWENGNNSNPTGLRYAASITYTTSSVLPPSFVSVGGEVFRVDKFQLLLPYIGAGLGAMFMLSLAINRLFFRKRQHIGNR